MSSNGPIPAAALPPPPLGRVAAPAGHGAAADTVPAGPSELDVEGCCVRFGGVHALQDVSLRVPAGQVTAIIGPNGAGKTTLFNAVTGLVRPWQGRILLGGRDVTGWPPYRRAQAGMARTFQNVRLFASLNVLENVMSGRYSRTRSGFWDAALMLPRDRRERRESREQAMELLTSLGVGDRALARPREIPYGAQRRVEIARALASQPRLLLLDEPTAGMTEQESTEMLQLIGELRERGRTVLLIEHNMRLVMTVADRITVLNFGRRLAEGTPAEIRDDPAVVEAYLGADE